MPNRLVVRRLQIIILMIFLTGCQNRLSVLGVLNLNSVNNASISGPPVNLIATKFPLEVMGSAGSVIRLPLQIQSLPAGGVQTLYVRTHGLNYNTQGSVQVNSGSWMPLSNSTVTVQGTAARFGGIGGSFVTLKMNIAISKTAFQVGANTISFRFNGTDGRSSGYRVLELNLLDGQGNEVLPKASFVQDDPSTWTPPLNNPTDIAAGQSLWSSATLYDSPVKATTKMLAHCADCHAFTGRDLKYFNYSNFSIEQRAMYHGLSSQQGQQIASYIRSLNVPNPGRPWNPPYQPGPGLDSQPISSWSAGAGVDAVVDSDTETQAYLPGNGTSAQALRNPATQGTTFSRFNVREVPVDFQFLDWNHWLPAQSPMDILGSVATFQSTTTYQLYQSIRANLSSSNSASYIQNHFVDDTGNWYFQRSKFLLPQAATAAGGLGTATGYAAAYDTAVWTATKLWEVMQDFNLEGVGPSLYGSRAENRSWVSTNRFIFDVSPHAVGNAAQVDFSKIQVLGDPNLGNTCPKTVRNPTGDCVGLLENQLARVWYEEQLILNAGQRQSLTAGFGTIDWGYMEGFVGGVAAYTGQMEPMQQMRFLLKQYDEHDLGIGPTDLGAGFAYGWNYRDNSTNAMNVKVTPMGGDYSTVPGANNVLKTAYQAYLEKTARIGISTFQAVEGTEYAGNNFAPADYILGSGSFPSTGAKGDNLNRSAADQWNTQIEALASRYGLPQALIDGATQYTLALWPNNAQTLRSLTSVQGGSAPSGVSVVSGVDQLNITWNAVGGASSYNVKRATSASDPHYQTVAYFLTGTSFADFNLDPAQTYYYKISANSTSGGLVDQLEGGDSAVVGGQPSAGLVSKWKLGAAVTGQIANDAGSGSGNPGTVFTDLLGNNFVGVQQNLSPWLGKSVTMTAWIQLAANFQSTGSVFNMPAIAGSSFYDSQMYTFGAVNNRGQIGLGFSSCGTTAAASSVFSTGSIRDGSLHFVAFTRDLTSGNIAVYVDGKLSGSAVASKGSCQGGRAFSLGRTDGGSNTVLAATFKDLRIYNNVLSASTIQSLNATGPQ